MDIRIKIVSVGLILFFIISCKKADMPPTCSISFLDNSDSVFVLGDRVSIVVDAFGVDKQNIIGMLSVDNSEISVFPYGDPFSGVFGKSYSPYLPMQGNWETLGKSPGNYEIVATIYKTLGDQIGDGLEFLCDNKVTIKLIDNSILMKNSSFIIDNRDGNK